MRKRTVHKCDAVHQVTGDVSALCYKTPRAINMRYATWSLRWEPVTCTKCLAKKPA